MPNPENQMNLQKKTQKQSDIQVNREEFHQQNVLQNPLAEQEKHMNRAEDVKTVYSNEVDLNRVLDKNFASDFVVVGKDEFEENKQVAITEEYYDNLANMKKELDGVKEIRDSLKYELNLSKSDDKGTFAPVLKETENLINTWSDISPEERLNRIKTIKQLAKKYIDSHWGFRLSKGRRRKELMRRIMEDVDQILKQAPEPRGILITKQESEELTRATDDPNYVTGYLRTVARKKDELKKAEDPQSKEEYKRNAEIYELDSMIMSIETDMVVLLSLQLTKDKFLDKWKVAHDKVTILQKTLDEKKEKLDTKAIAAAKYEIARFKIALSNIENTLPEKQYIESRADNMKAAVDKIPADVLKKEADRLVSNKEAPDITFENVEKLINAHDIEQLFRVIVWYGTNERISNDNQRKSDTRANAAVTQSIEMIIGMIKKKGTAFVCDFMDYIYTSQRALIEGAKAENKGVVEDMKKIFATEKYAKKAAATKLVFGEYGTMGAAIMKFLMSDTDMVQLYMSVYMKALPNKAGMLESVMLENSIYSNAVAWCHDGSEAILLNKVDAGSEENELYDEKERAKKHKKISKVHGNEVADAEIADMEKYYKAYRNIHENASYIENERLGGINAAIIPKELNDVFKNLRDVQTKDISKDGKNFVSSTFKFMTIGNHLELFEKMRNTAYDNSINEYKTAIETYIADVRKYCDSRTNTSLPENEADAIDKIKQRIEKSVDKLEQSL